MRLPRRVKKEQLKSFFKGSYVFRKRLGCYENVTPKEKSKAPQSMLLLAVSKFIKLQEKK